MGLASLSDRETTARFTTAVTRSRMPRKRMKIKKTLYGFSNYGLRRPIYGFQASFSQSPSRPSASVAGDHVKKPHNVRDLCLGMTHGVEVEQTVDVTTAASGKIKLDSLPREILGQIAEFLRGESPHSELINHNADLMSLLLTSRSTHVTALESLYRHIVISHSRVFQKFLRAIITSPFLACAARRIDFSHFNLSIFSTARERTEARNLTAETLHECLGLTPLLREFLAQEYIADELTAGVLRMLFHQLPRMQALDFCGCSSARFRDGFEEVLNDKWPGTVTIARLSLHKCATLSPAVFETILPRMRMLTHLDVAGTRITDKALSSLPDIARVTHLNIAKCRNLTPEGTVKLLSNHPAVNQSLVYLSVATDKTGHSAIHQDGLHQLLLALPSTMRSLSLKGTLMSPSHVALLATLARTLEELAIGRGLRLNDVHQIIAPQDQYRPHNLRYLDISDMETVIGSSNPMLAPTAAPLQVIELEEQTFRYIRSHRKKLESLEGCGWTLQEFGDRYRLVRSDSYGDNGARWWKMSTEGWGMRKVPVAVADVSCMYRLYMYGK